MDSRNDTRAGQPGEQQPELPDDSKGPAIPGRESPAMNTQQTSERNELQPSLSVAGAAVHGRQDDPPARPAPGELGAVPGPGPRQKLFREVYLQGLARGRADEISERDAAVCAVGRRGTGVDATRWGPGGRRHFGDARPGDYVPQRQACSGTGAIRQESGHESAVAG